MDIFILIVVLIIIYLISYFVKEDIKKKKRQRIIDTCDHEIEYDYVRRGYDDDYKYAVCKKCGYRRFLA